MVKLLYLWFALAAGPVWAQDGVELNFEDLPRLLSERNQMVTGSELLVESARTRAGYLRRSYLPAIDAEAGGERFQTGEHGWKTQPYGHVETKLNLFRGGRDRLESLARSELIWLSKANARKTTAAELLEARDTYWELVSNREMAKIIEESLVQNEKYLEKANRRIARGLASETDRLEFEIHRSQLQEELESLNHAAILLEIRLAAVVGLPLETRIKTPAAVAHIHEDALLSAAFDPASHPDVAALQARRRGLDLERRKAGSSWLPSLDLYGGYTLYTLREREFLSQSQRDDKAAGLRLSLPLFDGLQSRTEAKAFTLARDGVARQQAQQQASMDARVRIAKEDLKHDHELVHYAEERIEQGKKYLARTLDEYERGVKNSLDMLGAAQKYLAYRRQYAERRKGYQITKDRLLALFGQ